MREGRGTVVLEEEVPGPRKAITGERRGQQPQRIAGERAATSAASTSMVPMKCSRRHTGLLCSDR